MKPGLLASLLQDTNLLAQRVARLKELLPHTNVSAMASKLPEVLLQVKPKFCTRQKRALTSPLLRPRQAAWCPVAGD